MTIARPVGRPRLIALWDGRQWPGYLVGGMPAFTFRRAPAGLLTRRQLRAEGLRPDGHEPYALLIWRRGQRWAWLYREDLAKTKRVATPKQLTAIRSRALAARMVCTECGPVDHCVRKADGLCGTCYVAGITPRGTDRAGEPAWKQLQALGSAA